LTPEALATIQACTAAAYDQQRSEWGGLLWGRLFVHPMKGMVPVIVAATNGVCRATPTSCEILPASWQAGERELADQRLGGLQCLGDFHSHPKMGVFMSGPDRLSFWSYGHVSHWLGMVVDPWRSDYGIFAKCSADRFERIPCFVMSHRIAQVLNLPRPVSGRLAGRGHLVSSQGGNHRAIR